MPTKAEIAKWTPEQRRMLGGYLQYPLIPPYNSRPPARATRDEARTLRTVIVALMQANEEWRHLIQLHGKTDHPECHCAWQLMCDRSAIVRRTRANIRRAATKRNSK